MKAFEEFAKLQNVIFCKKKEKKNKSDHLQLQNDLNTEQLNKQPYKQNI